MCKLGKKSIEGTEDCSLVLKKRSIVYTHVPSAEYTVEL